jgi:hypothetical protein
MVSGIPRSLPWSQIPLICGENVEDDTPTESGGILPNQDSAGARLARTGWTCRSFSVGGVGPGAPRSEA